MFQSEVLLDDLCTQGFHVIDNFLELETCQGLYKLAQIKQTQGLFRPAKIGRDITSQMNGKIRADEICWINEQTYPPVLESYISKMELLANILNQSLFLGIREFETHFATYQPETFYKKHCDQFATNKRRKISCVYYLNPYWQVEFGGELKLYQVEGQLLHTVYPMGNRLICFNSELPHEVCVTHKIRYSIAGWMKTA